MDFLRYFFRFVFHIFRTLFFVGVGFSIVGVIAYGLAKISEQHMAIAISVIAACFLVGLLCSAIWAMLKAAHLFARGKR